MPNEFPELSPAEKKQFEEEVRLAFCGVEAIHSIKSAARAALVVCVIVMLASVISGRSLTDSHYANVLMFSIGWGYGSYISRIQSLNTYYVQQEGYSSGWKEQLVQWSPLLAGMLATLILMAQDIKGPIVVFTSLMVSCVMALGKATIRDALNTHAHEKK